jgi:hypothetical protein
MGQLKPCSKFEHGLNFYIMKGCLEANFNKVFRIKEQHRNIANDINFKKKGRLEKL